MTHDDGMAAALIATGAVLVALMGYVNLADYLAAHPTTNTKEQS